MKIILTDFSPAGGEYVWDNNVKPTIVNSIKSAEVLNTQIKKNTEYADKRPSGLFWWLTQFLNKTIHEQ